MGSPVMEQGTDVGLTSDIAGNPIGGAPEIGAYEILAPDLAPTMLSVTKTGNKIYVSDTVLNQGNTAAGPFTVAYYLSTDAVFDPATDLALANSPNGSGTCTRAVPALDAGATSSVTDLTCYRPSAMIEGVHYYVLGVIDSANQVVESNENNNVRATSGTIQR
jgi:subtilase family serine protease